MDEEDKCIKQRIVKNQKKTDSEQNDEFKGNYVELVKDTWEVLRENGLRKVAVIEKIN